MNNLKIKKENLANRCEVCHKKDLFLAESNYCFRCKELNNPKAKVTLSLRSTLPNFLFSNILIWKKENFLRTQAWVIFPFFFLVLFVSSFYLLPNANDIFDLTPPVLHAQTYDSSSSQTGSQTEEFSLEGIGCFNEGLSFDQIINIFGLLIFGSFLGVIVGLTSHFWCSYKLNCLEKQFCFSYLSIT